MVACGEYGSIHGIEIFHQFFHKDFTTLVYASR